MYKITTTQRGESVSRLNDDGSTTYIPADPNNTDYQEYLRWLEEGNTPESVAL